MRIAFASCFDAISSPEQPVWNRLREFKPKVLLLLGDSMYMDFFPHLLQSTKWPLQQFADEMYGRYAALWRVQGFRELLSEVERVGVIWDDHDYAWNNSHGAGAADKTHVPSEQRRISRALFSDYRTALGRPQDPYPLQPPLATLLDGPDTDIKEHFDHGGVRFILLDGRTYRTEPSTDGHVGDLHGAYQREWIKGLVQGTPGICVAASGSTLTHSRESWDNFLDYQWLMEQRLPRLLVLSGDIHSNKPRKHELNGYTLYEATSSGVARRGLGGASGNFGLLDLNGTEARLQWYDEDSDEADTEKTWQIY